MAPFAAEPRMMTLEKRPIRSFVRREGRMTPAQRDALATLWPAYGITPEKDQLADFKSIFCREAPLVCEIGFGMGESLATMAKALPEFNFLGVEVHRPGVGHLMTRLAEDELHNVRIIQQDAVEVLRDFIPAGCLDKVLLLFPDPWPKKRHHKRRIVAPGFLSLVHTALVPGGHLHMATDWQEYAEHMMQEVSADQRFKNVAGQQAYSPRPEYRPLTKFERRGLRLGHSIYDLIFARL